MDRTLVIRNAQENDIAALSEFAIQTYCEAFGHTFSNADLAAHLKKNLSPDSISRIIEDDVVLLAEVEARLIGYVHFGAVNSATDDNEQELRRLYIHPELQSQGYGSALMEAALRHPRLNGATNIYLDVWERNPGAQRFYRRYGFEVIGTRAFEVESGAATSLDLIMVRRASPEQQEEQL
jgi:ribosomal protein S18 acetylase RimI-like enzyme